MKVSIVLTSYNHERYIKESIESVLSQTFKDFELIIVDDCSKDNSWEIIKSFTDPRIKAIRNPRNLRTEGVKEAIKQVASGEYLAIHHSDDLWEQDKLEKQVKLMEEKPEISACFTWAEPIDEDGTPYQEESGFYYDVFEQPNRTRYEWLNYFFYYGNCLCHPSVLIRRELFLKENLFDFGFAQIPDMARWVKICLHHEIFIIPEKLTRFRIQKQGRNTSGSRPDTLVRSSIELFHMLRLYQEIPSGEEFLKVFPDGNEFVCEEFFNIQYSLGRYFTRDDMDSFTRLLGYEFLYEVMNDEWIAGEVEKYYHYTFRDLIKSTGEKDIFGVLPEKAMQTARIYVDTGDGFEEIEELKTCFFIQDYYDFKWEIEVPERLKRVPLRQIRFDPVEGILVKFRMEGIWGDEVQLELIASNAEGKLEDYDVFTTEDPMYVYNVEGKRFDVIKVQGEVRRLTNEDRSVFEKNRHAELAQMVWERDNWLKQKERERQRLEDEWNQCTLELQNMKQQLDPNKEELEFLQKQAEELETELYKVKNHFLYKMWRNANKIKSRIFKDK